MERATEAEPDWRGPDWRGPDWRGPGVGRVCERAGGPLQVNRPVADGRDHAITWRSPSPTTRRRHRRRDRFARFRRPAATRTKAAKVKAKKPVTAQKLALEDPNSPPRPPAFGGEAPQPLVVDGLKLTGQVIGRGVRVATPSGMKPHFWAGVNLGATVPATSPGELAPTREDYDRWFVQIGQMGSTILRVCTILPPRFYDAFRAYNLKNPKQPLFVLHGVWVPEDRMYEVQTFGTVKLSPSFAMNLPTPLEPCTATSYDRNDAATQVVRTPAIYPRG